MNHTSKIHQSFSDRLRNPRVLTNPEDFLGKNYKAVLNFWSILDDLSEEQIKDIAFGNENYSEWDKTRDLAWEAANLACEASWEVIGFNYAYHAGNAAWEVTKTYDAFLATRELIGMHLILEQQKPLTFFPMFLEVL